MQEYQSDIKWKCIQLFLNVQDISNAIFRRFRKEHFKRTKILKLRNEMSTRVVGKTEKWNRIH